MSSGANYRKDEDYPLTSVGGYAAKYMSLHRCLDACVDVDCDSLRADQMAQRDNNGRGVGVATFVEAAAFGRFITVRRARVSTQDGCTSSNRPAWSVMTGVTDQGQGR